MPIRQLARNSVLLLLLGFAVSVTHAETDMGRPPLTPVAASERGRRDVAVMGRVRLPGVYAFFGPAPTVVEAIERAGGLAPDASGQIRIVRSGRAMQSTFLGPDLKLTAESGDVLVAERTDVRLPAADESQEQADIFSPATTPASASQSDPVLVGVVNVLDWPVVLAVPRRQATLAKLGLLLGQPIENPNDVYLLPTSATRGRFSASDVSQPPLNSGTVLVFDPLVVDRTRIPTTLPAGVDAASVDGFRPFESQAGPAMHPLPGLKPDPEPDRGAQPAAETAGTPIATMPGDASKIDIAADAAQVTIPEPHNQIRGQAPQPGVPKRDVNRLLPATVGSRALQTSPVVKHANASSAVSPAGRTAESSPTVPPSARSWTSVDATWWAKSIMWALGAAAGLFALGLLVALARRAILVSQAAQISARRRENPLESLIRNELPLVEEPIRLQRGQRFYGFADGPRQVRIDAAHELSGPHVGQPDGSVPERTQGARLHTAAELKSGQSAQTESHGVARANTAAIHAAAQKAAQTTFSARSTATSAADAIRPATSNRELPRGSMVGGESGLLDRALESLERKAGN